MTNDATYRLTDTVIYRDQGENATVFDAVTGEIFSGNGSAAAVLRALQRGSATPAQLAAVLRDEFAVGEADDVAGSLEAFLADLLARGLVSRV